MKILALAFLAVTTLGLVACQNDKPAPPAAAASSAKPAGSAAPAATGGW